MTKDSKPDWNIYAIRQANRARTKCRYVTRSVALVAVPDLDEPVGASPDYSDLGISVFFGNDGFLRNAQVREEVRIIRTLLGIKGVPVLGFGVCDRGTSWALVAKSDDFDLLNCILNAAHAWAFLREIAATRAMALDWLHDLGVTAEQLER